MQADPDLAETIARRVVELLGAVQPGANTERFVDAATLARVLRVERDWVYLHAAELGAIRLGGPKGRLRFDLNLVKERLSIENIRASRLNSWRPGLRGSTTVKGPSRAVELRKDKAAGQARQRRPSRTTRPPESDGFR